MSFPKGKDSKGGFNSTFLDGSYTQADLDYLVLDKRLNEITKKLESKKYEGELVPRGHDFEPEYDSLGRRILGTNVQTKIRLENEKASIRDVILPKNEMFKVWFFILSISFLNIFVYMF